MDWPDAFGLAGASFDGNNVLDAYAATRQAVDACRAGHGPVLLVTETFRMGGHATHDEREARATFDAELFEFWGKRDPVGLYEEVLVRDGVPRDVLEAVEHRIATEVESAAEEALKSRQRPAPTRDDAAKDVFYEAAHG
jgi:TPP-dependent pyruvate/acetoin dehydrogenase alpha subunit